MSVNRVASTVSATQGSQQRVQSSGSTGFSAIYNSSKVTTEADLEQYFEAASKKYNIPIDLLKAVARVESNFHANATSRCGAMGIMQLMPRTAKYLGVTDAYDPEQNIMGGAKYLRQLLNEFDGDTRVALAAYNAGPGTVNRYGGIPSFAEGYVNKVMKYYNGDASIGGLSSSSGSGASSGLTGSMSATSDSGVDMTAALLRMCQTWALKNTDDLQSMFAQAVEQQ